MSRPPATADLENLLPARTVAVLSAEPVTDSERLPDAPLPSPERAATGPMQPARREAFVHGRTCARAALNLLGVPNPVIPVGADREPVWPAGIVGSISHCGPVAAAAVARSEDVGGLGIDLETDEPLDRQTLPLICRASERDALVHAKDELHRAKLIFSAKESIYKCLWPIVRHFVDFQDVGIRIEPATRSFAATEWYASLPDPVIGSVRGRYLVRDGWILTAAWLPGDITKDQR